MKNFINSLIKGKNKALVILAIFSFVILPITYSRYIEKGYGSSFSSLANWNVEMISSDSEELELLAHSVSESTYSFNITSTSEVACDYSIALTNIPNDINVYVDNTLRNVSSGTVNISKLGGFDLGSENTTHSHIIKFVTTNSTSAKDINVNLDVTIKQRIAGDA